MLRALLVCVGIVLFTWLGFEYFPGHTYLQSDTQIYLPILHRLDNPGYLSRDLVATNPHVAYTIYDEIALFFHRTAHIDFEHILVWQQLIYRVAAVFGVYLLASSAGVPAAFSILIAAVFNLGASLPGPAVLLIEYEPIPRGYAEGLIFLALGLLAHRQVLLAGVAGGLAFLYHPPTTAPFWGIVLLVFVADRKLRAHWRVLVLALFIAGLLLANLAQLQPQVVEPQNLFGHLSERMIELQHFRTRYAWVSLWAGSDIWNYVAVCVLALWGTSRIWGSLSRQLKWFFVGLPIGGVLCIPLSYVLLERWNFIIVPEFQPSRALLYTVGVASIACGIAAVKSATERRFFESWAWFLAVFALPVNVRVFDIFRLQSVEKVGAMLVWVGLAALAAGLCHLAHRGWTRPLTWAAPALAVFAIPAGAHVVNFQRIDKQPLIQLADWAAQNTWGSSMFLFPDAEHGLEPGIFRALSQRALYVDWKSGGQVNYFESFGEEWYTRFKQTMMGDFTALRLEKMLDLPVDYYVLKHEHKLKGIKPVFENDEFVVYDAQDLRNSSTSLRLGTEG